MKDREIVALFWKRSPQALEALEDAYGPQLRRLAGNILANPQDAEECVNDAYLGLWDSIPPAQPQPLLPYALRVVRNLCLKRYRWNTAQKRRSQFDLAYHELEGCLADSSGPEDQQDLRDLPVPEDLCRLAAPAGLCHLEGLGDLPDLAALRGRRGLWDQWGRCHPAIPEGPAHPVCPVRQRGLWGQWGQWGP